MTMASRSLPGVLYAEDFDLPDTPPSEPDVARVVAEPVTLEPTFSLTDLRRAADQALEEGRVLERRAADQETESRRLDALCRIAEALRDSRAGCAEVASVNATATARAVLAAVAAILPALAATQALPEVRHLLDLLLPAMDGEPVLQIRVHPTLIEELRNDLESLAGIESITLDWVGVETMELGDVLAKWTAGTLVRDTRSLCNQICALMVPHPTISITKG